jgi:hypothetical protein
VGARYITPCFIHLVGVSGFIVHMFIPLFTNIHLPHIVVTLEALELGATKVVLEGSEELRPWLSLLRFLLFKLRVGLYRLKLLLKSLQSHRVEFSILRDASGLSPAPWPL